MRISAPESSGSLVMERSPEIDTGSFAPRFKLYWPGERFRLVDWNIDRGLKLSGIVEFLESANADLILLQEADLNARRTHRLNIAREIARRLRMNYVFGREFQELTQGSSNSPAYHGQATLSRWPMFDPRILRFRRQTRFWKPRWFLPDVEPFQERLGGRMSLVTELNLGGRKLVSYNLHLESRGDDTIRCVQLDECLDDVRRFRSDNALVIAGDFNMDVPRSSADHAMAQAGFHSSAEKNPAQTTPPRFLFERGRTIDWIFIRGPVRGAKFCVHSSVFASDHFPLSVNLDLT
jgi:endonuclease/exonuclease/phosphatase family metal-dependent hydrolase